MSRKVPPPGPLFLNSFSEKLPGFLRSSSRRPAGHQPPHLIRCLSATSSAARSTPVCPPEIIFNSIAGWNDVGLLDHQNDATLRRARPMPNTLGNDKALTRCELDRFIFEIDQEFSIQREKELVDLVVLVPVIFAFQNADADN